MPEDENMVGWSVDDDDDDDDDDNDDNDSRIEVWSNDRRIVDDPGFMRRVCSILGLRL